jgi:hypothetical protein
MTQSPSEESWRVRLMGSNLPWGSRPDRPADVGDELCTALLARENILEDANYQKITPNQFVVEIGMENYSRNYQLLKDQILLQWNDKLLVHLLTANSRQGRQEFRFAGPLKIEIHPVEDLGNSQIRIFSRVKISGEFDSPADGLKEISACLEILPEKRRWKLRPGIMTIGRDPGCDLFLEHPAIQHAKLVSSLHAYLYCKSSSIRLFDGTPNGQPSLNGTFVNFHPLPANGIELKNGDLILLAALDGNRPNPDTPGVASLRFTQEC